MQHHAYYIEGDLARFDAYAQAIPHIVAQKYERFGIDEARALTERAGFKVIGREAVFVVGASAITNEAQQALLKLFEEPQVGVVFVLLVPHGTLLPTLRSRMLPYPELLDDQSQTSVIARQFLKASGKARSELIAALLKDEDGVKERVRTLLDGLERELARLNLAQKEVRQGLEDIAKVRSYVGDRSPSLKMLLEHLAISLPQL